MNNIKKLKCLIQQVNNILSFRPSLDFDESANTLTSTYANGNNAETTIPIPTNTSDLNNDGENGTAPFITVNDIPEYDLSPISGTNTFTLLKDGVSTGTILDLNLYLDDTNLARLVSGVVDPLTGIATVTRDDNTTFTIDMSSLIDTQPTSTQQLLNEGVDGSSTYVENDEITKIATTGLSVRNENNIEQFNTTEIIQFENVDFSPTTNKVIGVKLPLNTFLGNVSSTITDKYILKNYFLTPTGSSWSNADADEFIKGFEIVGTDIQCTITTPYRLINNAFRDPFGLSTITYYYDNDGLMTSLNFQNFRDNVNIEEVIFPGCTGSTQFVFSGCTNLTKAIMPKISYADFSACTSLSEIDFSGASTLDFTNCTSLSLPTITRDTFPSARTLGLACFQNVGLGSVDMPDLVSTGGQGFVNNTTITSFESQNLKRIETTAFRNCTNLTRVYAPNVEFVGDDSNNGITTFWSTNALQSIFIPKCKYFGTSGSVFGNVFNSSISGVIITVHEDMKTANFGSPDLDLLDAIAKGAIIKYATDIPQSFEGKVLDVGTTYVDDTAASAGGIGIGERYISTTGFIKVRLT